MSSDGIASGDGGQKRRADDDFDLLTAPISLKPTPPYDLNQEQDLHAVAQSKEWATYKGCEQQLEDLLTGPLVKYGYTDKFILDLLEEVRRSISGRKSENLILCLTGPMGMGKSATLNSLLGVGTIAREGDLGGSCTLASCMYQAPKKDQAEPFLAEVNFFDRMERRDILRSYLASYYHASHGNNDGEDAETGNQQATDDAEMDLDIRNEVINALVSLFGNKLECRTKQDARNFLDGASSPEDEGILVKLYAWCDSLITRATGGKPVITISASTADGLNKALEDFTAYAEDDSGNLTISLTPMVSRINFYFDSVLLRLGIGFLDTPGSSDFNRTRKKSSQKASNARTHCAIFSDEARVKDDAGISKEMKRMKGAASARTVIVITKSDIIKDTTMPGGSKKDKEAVERLKRSLETCKKELDVLDIQECEAAEDEDGQRLAQIAKEKRVLDVRAILLANAERAHRITLRSASNKKALEEKLRYKTTITPPILSISNTEYARHLAGYKARDTPVLDVEQTNIPSLRRIISTFPNEARLDEMRHQQEVELPALLNRVKLYTSQSPSDRKEHMMKHVMKPKAQFSKNLMSVFADVHKAVEEFLGKRKAQRAIWTKIAGGLCDGWREEFKSQIFLGLLRRDGHRRGNRRYRQVNLSGDLININSEAISTLFDLWTARILDLERNVIQAMDVLVSNMLTDLRNDPNEPLMALGPFYEYTNGERAKFRGLVRATFRALLNGADEIHRKLDIDEEDAYLVEAMLPIYAQTRLLIRGSGLQPGGGWPAYREFVFKREVTKPNGVWATVCANAASDFQELLTAESDRLVGAMSKLFDGFESGFNMLCQGKEAKHRGAKLVRSELKINVEMAEQILNGPMRQAYEALERDFRAAQKTKDLPRVTFADE